VRGKFTGKRFLRTVLIFLLLFSLGQVIPRKLLYSRPPAPPEGGPTPETAQAFAAVAHFSAYMLACTGPEAFLCTGVQVVQVTPLPQSKAEGCPYPYIAKVRVYTIFSLPYDTVTVNCHLGTYREGRMRWGLTVFVYLTSLLFVSIIVQHLFARRPRTGERT